MGSLKSVRWCFAFLCVVVFSSFTALAAANGVGPISDASSQKPRKKSTAFGYSTGHLSDSKGGVAFLDLNDIPADQANEFLQKNASVPLYSDSGKTVWSLAPSFSELSMNPMQDLKNLAVMFQYRF